MNEWMCTYSDMWMFVCKMQMFLQIIIIIVITNTTTCYYY